MKNTNNSNKYPEMNIRKADRLFIDMDGTICKWKAATVEELYEPGYFLNLEPDAALLRAFRPLISKDGHERSRARGEFFYITGCYLDPDADIYILSAALGIPQIYEKNIWLDEYFPVPYPNRIFCECIQDKAYAAESYLGESVNSGWCFIDNYSPNCCKWSVAGGYAMKYINGINGSGKVWKGKRLELAKG